jgi:hypothetical protein
MPDACSLTNASFVRNFGAGVNKKIHGSFLKKKAMAKKSRAIASLALS